MLVFPQFVTGASALYPLVKRQVRRTVVNRLDGGNTDVYADAGAGEILVWDLQARGMTRAESDAVETLFQTSSGARGTFTFLDPAGNLLTQSETLTDAVWIKDALMTLTAGVADPLGTLRATNVSNGALASGHLSQTLNAPGNFHYCFSGWIRSSSGSSVMLSFTSGATTIAKTFTPGTQWQRVFVSGNPAQAPATTVIVEVGLAAGGSADVFGFQMEAQLGLSDYKRTSAQGGVYPKARFAADQLTVTAMATDVYDAAIRIVSQ